jgi:hypothetical protein
MNRSADLSQAEDAERHLGQRKEPGRPPLVSYAPQADQQRRPFDSYERFDADEPYDSYGDAAFRRARNRTPSSRAFLFVMLTALNTTVASILSVIITLGVVRRERSDVQPQEAPVVVRSEPMTPHVAIQRINLGPIGSPDLPLRLEPHKPAQLSLQIEPEAAANEPFILALSNAPAGTMLSGATQISSDTWFLSPSSADRLEIALPEWSTSVFEISLVLRHTDGSVAAQNKAWIAVPPPAEVGQLFEEFLKWTRRSTGVPNAERHSGQRKKPGRPPVVSYTPQADQQNRPVDSYERRR